MVFNPPGFVRRPLPVLARLIDDGCGEQLGRIELADGESFKPCLSPNFVQWSDHLAKTHGLPEGGFDGMFATYVREIRPDEPGRVHASSSGRSTTCRTMSSTAGRGIYMVCRPRRFA